MCSYLGVVVFFSFWTNLGVWGGSGREESLHNSSKGSTTQQSGGERVAERGVGGRKMKTALDPSPTPQLSLIQPLGQKKFGKASGDVAKVDDGIFPEKKKRKLDAMRTVRSPLPTVYSTIGKENNL